jgi:hypothetical protein
MCYLLYNNIKGHHFHTSKHMDDLTIYCYIHQNIDGPFTFSPVNSTHITLILDMYILHFSLPISQTYILFLSQHLPSACISQQFHQSMSLISDVSQPRDVITLPATSSQLGNPGAYLIRMHVDIFYNLFHPRCYIYHSLKYPLCVDTFL